MGWLSSTPTSNPAGGASGNEAAPPPTPMSRTEPPAGRASKARAWAGRGPSAKARSAAWAEGSGGSGPGRSGAAARISGGRAQAPRAADHCSAAEDGMSAHNIGGAVTLPPERLRPHPDRLSPDHPRYEEIVAVHAAAV